MPGVQHVNAEVGLLSGKTATVAASLDGTVDMLKHRAQTSLGVGSRRLVDSFGTVLDVCVPIKEANVQTGDSLTLHLSQVQACATSAAFAAILSDGSAVTWVIFVMVATVVLRGIS